MKLSIVVPLYNEEEGIRVFHEGLIKVLSSLKNINFSIIYVLDAPTDNTLGVISNIIDNDKSAQALLLAKRYGHQPSLMAGIEYSLNSDCIIMMDGDLQHPPELIESMIDSFKEGFDVVYTIRESTLGSSYFKSLTSKAFYRVLNFLSDSEISPNTPDFRLISNRVANYLVINVRDKNLYLRGIIANLGYKQKALLFKANERFAGRSCYSLKSSFSLAISAVLLTGKKLLYLIIYCGVAVSTVAFLFGVYMIYNYFIDREVPHGWSTTAVLISFLGGAQILMMGVIGIYISRLMDEIACKPSYLIEKIIRKSE